MKENNIDNEEKENDFEDSIHIEESEENSERKNSDLILLDAKLGEKPEPKIKSLNDFIHSDSNIDSNISYQILDKTNIILSKYLYISKDFIFIFFLLLSPALNFSYLYLPFFILALLSYFLL